MIEQDISFSDNSHLGHGPLRVLTADVVSGMWCLEVKMPQLEQRAFLEKWANVPGVCWHIVNEW